MRAHRLSFFFFIILLSTVSATILDSSARRILHQPLFPENSSPPSPPPPASPVLPTPDQPFFPEVPGGGTPDQAQPPPATPANGTIPIPAATQPAKPTKTVAIAISVGIVTLGMLSALAFFLYRHRVKHPGDTQKLVGAPNSQRFEDDSRVQPSSFLYIGTVEPSTRSSVGEANGVNGSPYHKLNSIKRSDRYRPSPELQPLPPLSKPIHSNFPAAAESPSYSDEESQDAAFYTPQCSSVVSNEDGSGTPGSRQNHLSLVVSGRAAATGSVPHSKRTSPKSRLSGSSPDMKPVMIPPVKQTPPPPKAPVPPPPPPQLRPPDSPVTAPIPHHQKPRFSAPPPPPNWALLKSKNNSPPSVEKTRIRSAAQGPPPPPPPPPALLSTPQKLGPIEAAESKTPSQVVLKTTEPWTPSPREVSGNGMRKPIQEVENSAGSSTRADTDDTDGAKPKLKPLHWDKVRATSDRATVWDQLEPSSFQLNEDMMESLFGCNTVKSAPKEQMRRSVLPPVEKENRVLDPKKSQNIAILLRALNVTRDEVSEALLDGNPESLGVELLESLVKMAPTKEEEIKLRDYNGDVSKLGSAERFLKQVLDIPFAFKRVEAMLYRGNFDSELKYLRSSFQTLEAACEELKNSRLFLKLLEAVLRTGNRMNVGTNRGDAKSFKLDTLLKLVDVKGTDGKTTLLHFVVQEIIRTEGEGTDSTSEISQSKLPSKTKEENFRKQGLQVVAGLGRDLVNVKNAAGMDSNVLSGYVSKLEMGLEKVRLVLQYEKTDSKENFFHSMKLFLKEAEEEIARTKAGERKALSLVKDVTQYFHGSATREEPHPFRIFMIVRDFLSILDNVCKEVGRMQDRTMVGSARSFRISATASLPVLNRYNVRQDGSSDEGSSSP